MAQILLLGVPGAIKLDYYAALNNTMFKYSNRAVECFIESSTVLENFLIFMETKPLTFSLWLFLKL